MVKKYKLRAGVCLVARDIDIELDTNPGCRCTEFTVFFDSVDGKLEVSSVTRARVSGINIAEKYAVGNAYDEICEIAKGFAYGMPFCMEDLNETN